MLRTYLDDEEKPFTGKFIEKGWEGQLIKESHFKNGILEGKYIEYDTRGENAYISVEGEYKNGNKIGEFIEWWRLNHKKKVSNYDEKGERHGKTIFYAGFSVEEPESEQNYSHGKKDGDFIWYYSGGQIKSSEILQRRNKKRI